MVCLPNKLAHGDRLDPNEPGQYLLRKQPDMSIFASGMRHTRVAISGVRPASNPAPRAIILMPHPVEFERYAKWTPSKPES